MQLIQNVRGFPTSIKKKIQQGDHKSTILAPHIERVRGRKRRLRKKPYQLGLTGQYDFIITLKPLITRTDELDAMIKVRVQCRT